MGRLKQAGSNYTDLTEMNRSLIVKILQHRRVCSRAELAKITGLTQAAITKIVSVLIEIGIVTETGIMSGKNGHRAIGLELNASKYQVIGVKVARRTASVGVFDISGCLYTQQEFHYASRDNPFTVLSDIKRQIIQYQSQYTDIVAMGIAVPGPYLRQEGCIVTVTGMPLWHKIDFKAEFEHAYEFPVYMEHDANAGALAEWLFGTRESAVHSLTYFLLGEGVGAGIVERGEVILGKRGTAGEVGHISIDVHGPKCECGNYGCLELYCSAYAVEQYVRADCKHLLSTSDITPQEICKRLFSAARLHDEAALLVTQKIARYIGYGCVNLINAYNPEVIAIGDILSTGLDVMQDTIMEVVTQCALEPIAKSTIIQCSALETDAILTGAAALATNQVLRLPSAFSKNRTK